MANLALDATPRFQWETNSGTTDASQKFNCGATCMAFILGYYKNYLPGIEALRRSVTSCCAPIDITDQRDMLTLHGVPAQIYRVATLANLKSLISTGRRPVGLRVYMAYVPYTYRGHTFTEWHEITAIANTSVGGTSGIVMNDPNFSPPGGYRPDPQKGHRFYPDWVVQQAFINHQPAYAVLPIEPKYIPPPPPPPAPAPAPSTVRADGDPYPMRFRRITTGNDRFVARTIRSGKPIRTGALVTSTTMLTTKEDTAFSVFGYIPKADLPLAEQKYGDVFMGAVYHSNGDHIGYVKAVDLR